MHDRLTELFHLHFSKSGSAVQDEEFLELVNSGKHDLQLQELFESLYQQYDINELTDQLDYYPAGARERMLQNIFSAEEQAGTEIQTKKLSIWKHTGFRTAVAAAVATLIFGAGLFLFKSTKIKQQDSISYNQDVAPGKQGATLTLSSGKKIRLSEALNGRLAEEAGVEISKTADGQLEYRAKDMENVTEKTNTISTSNGETYILILPDGSKVWLNSASSLSYSAGLTSGGKRRVQLRGEGYFEVAKNRDLPFVVETEKQQVEVLGTHFNVNAYADEPAVATTLVEGSVKVSSDGKQQVIRPGEQALTALGHLVVQKANMEGITDWKDGDFNLNDMDFRVAMRKIARWYDVEVVYDQDIRENIQTGGWISRDRKLSVVLKSIESSGFAKFRIEGRRVYVSR